MHPVHIRRAHLTSDDAVRLIAALNSELTAMFPEPGATHFSLPGAQVEMGEGAFLVAYLDDTAVGCGAVRRLDTSTAELKRMYVAPSLRGRGIGRALVDALESEARQLGVTSVVLETGTRLTAAIRLYESMGYARIPPAWLLGPVAGVGTLLLVGSEFGLFASGGGLLMAAAIGFWTGAAVAAVADPARQVRNAVVVAAAVAICLSAYLAAVSSRPAPPGTSFGGPTMPPPTP